MAILTLSLQDNFADLRTKFNSLSNNFGDLTLLTTSASSLVEAMNNLDSNVSTIDLAPYDSDIGVLQTTVVNLDSDITALNVSLNAALDSDVSALNAALDSDVNALETTIAAIDLDTVATVGGTTSVSITTGGLTTTGTIDVSGGTLTLANNQISGDKIDGGTISTFASTGIDDNATTTTITISDSDYVGIGTTNPTVELEVNGAIKSSGFIQSNNLLQPDTGTIYTSNTSVAAGERIFANTNGGAFIVTLPGSPSAGDTVGIVDYSGTFETNNLTVGRNGNPIFGIADDLALDINYISIDLMYIDGTKGWVMV